MEPALGLRMHSAGIVLKGALPETRWLELLHAVAKAIGMSAVGEAKVCSYPLPGNKGGTGQSIFLPITESFLVLDTWSDHGGAYLFVCSCRAYFTKDIDDVAREFGLVPSIAAGARFYAELELK